MPHKYLVIWIIIEFCRVFNLPPVILTVHGTPKRVKRQNFPDKFNGIIFKMRKFLAYAQMAQNQTWQEKLLLIFVLPTFFLCSSVCSHVFHVCKINWQNSFALLWCCVYSIIRFWTRNVLIGSFGYNLPCTVKITAGKLKTLQNSIIIQITRYLCGISA